MIRPWAVLGPVFLVVSGCAQFERPAADPEEVRAAIEAEPSLLIDPSESEVMERAIVAQEPPPLPRRKPEVALQPEETIEEADPGMLIGLDFTVTRALLGEPALQTEHSPAKIWTYNGQKCMLKVFFYPSVEGGAFRLLTYEAVNAEKPEGNGTQATGANGANGSAGTVAGAAASTEARAAAGNGQGSEKQPPDEVTAFTRACFTGLLREAEQQRESARLKKAERTEESGQTQEKEPPQAE